MNLEHKPRVSILWIVCLKSTGRDWQSFDDPMVRDLIWNKHTCERLYKCISLLPASSFSGLLSSADNA